MSSDKSQKEKLGKESKQETKKPVITNDTNKIFRSNKLKPNHLELSVTTTSSNQGNQEKNKNSDIKEKLKSHDSQEVDFEDGGEWELLVKEIKDWVSRAKPHLNSNLWSKVFITIAGILLIAVVAMIYGKILEKIAFLPFAPKVLELVGLAWFSTFSIKKIFNHPTREKVLFSEENRFSAKQTDHEQKL